MRKQKLALFLLVLFTAVTLPGCASPGGTPPTGSPSGSEVQDIGQGAAVFAFEVTDDQETTVKYAVHTDEETVGAALLKLEMIEGDSAEFGLYVKAVNGVTADYDADKAYWAFYVDGEYATAGVDATSIEPGKTYAFVYTKD